MEDGEKLRVYKKHSGEERIQRQDQVREERTEAIFERRQKMKENAKTRAEIIHSRQLSEGKVVFVETKEGSKEGKIDSFDENRRVWVLFESPEGEEANKRDLRLFEPIDIEPKN